MRNYNQGPETMIASIALRRCLQALKTLLFRVEELIYPSTPKITWHNRHWNWLVAKTLFLSLYPDICITIENWYRKHSWNDDLLTLTNGSVLAVNSPWSEQKSQNSLEIIETRFWIIFLIESSVLLFLYMSFYASIVTGYETVSGNMVNLHTEAAMKISGKNTMTHETR